MDTYFAQLFSLADTSRDNRISAQEITFLRKSGLDVNILGQIWRLVATSNFLSRQEFYIALKLVALAQKGERLDVNAAMARNDLIPVFEGISVPSMSSGINLSQTNDWVVSPQMRKGYYSFFTKLDTDSDGFVSGNEAQSFFSKSNVANNVLAAIWRLSDIDKDNRLDFNEFCVAMFLVQAAQAGRSMPVSLPPGLKESAFQGNSNPNSSGTDVLASLVQLPTVKPQVVLTNSPKSQRKDNGPRSLGVWTITPKEEKTFMKSYLAIDKNHDGFVSTYESKDLFMMSELSTSDLAKIIELVDFDKDGRLNKIEFFIAMKLITQRKKGTKIPQRIPDELFEAVGLEGMTHRGKTAKKDIPDDLNQNLQDLKLEFANLKERNSSLSYDLEVVLRHKDQFEANLQEVRYEIASKEREIELQDMKIRNIEDKILHTEGQLLEISSALGENSADITSQIQKKISVAQARLEELNAKIAQAQSQL